MRNTGAGGRISRPISTEQRHAAHDFLDGFWASDERKSQFTALLEALWRDFKSEPEYERLRQSMSDSARKRGR